jgi:hypothetical protein
MVHTYRIMLVTAQWQGKKNTYGIQAFQPTAKQEYINLVSELPQEKIILSSFHMISSFQIENALHIQYWFSFTWKENFRHIYEWQSKAHVDFPSRISLWKYCMLSKFKYHMCKFFYQTLTLRKLSDGLESYVCNDSQHEHWNLEM